MSRDALTGIDDATAPAVLRLGRAPLVGRQRELAALEQALAEARLGRPTLALLAGEPGIGKSRLLEEFPPSGQSGDSIVLRGGATQSEGMPPYLPLLEALGEYIALAPPDDLRRGLGADAAVLARLLPEIASRLRESFEPPHAIPPEQERLRLYEVVAGLLSHIAGARGSLILALDDLQWADAATCELLLYVMPRLAARAAPVLVVTACRDDETSENVPLERLISELNSRRLLLHVTLRRLDSLESRQLAAALLHGDLAEDVSSIVHDQGEGNPFFEEELLRALVDERRWSIATAVGTSMASITACCHAGSSMPFACGSPGCPLKQSRRCGWRRSSVAATRCASLRQCSSATQKWWRTSCWPGWVRASCVPTPTAGTPSYTIRCARRCWWSLAASVGVGSTSLSAMRSRRRK